MKNIEAFTHWTKQVLPTVYSDALSHYELLEKVITHLNEIGALTNETVAKWLAVMEWIENEGLEDAVNARLDEWLADGTLADIINITIFGQLNDDIAELKILTAGAGVALNKYVTDPSVSDCTVDFQRALDAAAGKTLIFPANTTYNVKALFAPTKIKMNANKSKLKSIAHCYVLTIQSDTVINDIEIEGNGWTTPNESGRGINILGGAYNSRKINIEINNPYIHDIGYQGIYTKFSEDVRINNPRITRCGYAGIVGNSDIRTYVKDGSIIDIKGKSGGNGYGVTFTRDDNDSLLIYPTSLDSTVDGTYVEGVPTWEGLDTHGAFGATFKNGKIRKCKSGIVLTDAANSAGDDVFGSHNTLIQNMDIELNDDGAGINISGSTDEKARNNRVFNTIFRKCGIAGLDTYGAIRMSQTFGTKIQGCTFDRSRVNHIVIISDNELFDVSGCTFQDVHDTTNNSYGVYVSGGRNTGFIGGGNVFGLTPATDLLAKVGTACVRFSTSVENMIELGQNFNGKTGFGKGYTLLYSNMSPVSAHFGQIGDGAYKFVGYLIPEGLYTAQQGSTYQRLTNGSPAMYIKEGTGNTGWMPLTENTLSGVSSGRPTGGEVGRRYYDTTLNRPIWLKLKPSTWQDAMGTIV